MTSKDWDRLKEIFGAALQCDVGSRSRFLREACANNEPLLRELESLVADYESAQTFLQTSLSSSVSDRSHSRRDARARPPVGAYRLLHLIGRGGMADVWLAARSDSAYHRLVAIKIVRVDDLEDDRREIVSRFRHERQALAVLDHPNIVKLLDGGTTEDGRPYLVMDYVEGLAIDEYCEHHRCSIPERLQLFCTVCAAVHYAHQNLIVHRDLKPRNILVTTDGAPKLLDFGIAKLLHPERWSETLGLTRADQRLLTPAYASPEQLRGDPITTASDVYSLGVLLYQLLTGHSPYPAHLHTPSEYERAICDLPPLKPSRLKGELGTIVFMALRKEPQRRYASVEQFAEDLRRYLKGLPVIACRDTFRYRSGKFMRRHAAALATAAGVLVLLLAMLAVTIVQRRAAESQRARAERRFSDVRQLAHFMLFDVEEVLRSGATPARKALIVKALDYLDRLRADAADDVSLQRELIEGYLKVGDLQGNLFGPNLGDARGAVASYERALQMAEAVQAIEGRTPRARRDVARVHQKMAELMAVGGDATQAITRFQAAIEIFTSIATRQPASREASADLLSIWDRLGSTQYVIGDLQSARQSYERYLDLARRLVSQAAGEPVASQREAQRALAKGDEELGKILTLSGQPDEGLTRMRKALATYEALAAADPTNAWLRRAVSVTYTNLGDMLASAGRRDEALTHYRRGLSAIEQLAREDPANRQSQRDLALTTAFLADVVSKTGDAGEAHTLTRRALEMLRGLAEHPDASALNHRDYAWLLVSTPIDDLRDPAAARRHAQSAMLMTNGTDPSTLDTLATAYFQSGEVARAINLEERAIALLPPPSASGHGSHLRVELEANLARFKSSTSIEPGAAARRVSAHAGSSAVGSSPTTRPQQSDRRQP